MTAVDSVLIAVPLSHAVIGTLTVRCLPSRPGGLWDYREAAADDSLLPVQVLEGHEYAYEVESPGFTGPVEIRPEEVFISDGADGRRGRLRPGLYTGALTVQIRAGGDLGQTALEVRSKKLDYVREYRWMLRDIAESISEIVMHRFGPSEQKFSPDSNRDPATLYQRFAFLKSALADESLMAAFQRILSKPHVAWEETSEFRRPGQGWPGGSGAMRQLSGVGQRTMAPGFPGAISTMGVPTRLAVNRTQPSIDNVPNQFVKYALTEWRDIAASVHERMQGVPGPAGERGRRESAGLRDELDALLSEELFREVEDLKQFPGANQVLEKRPGYRDVLRTFLLCELASQLAWSGGEDVYGAGQKDVAMLYEYWTFLQLAGVVATVCQVSFSWEELFAHSPDRMGIELRRGQEICLRGETSVNGRPLRLSLFFNRTFSRHSATHPTWTLPMRPDCSLLVESGHPSDRVFEPVWLHFDAKYRIEALGQVMPTPTASEEEDRGVAEDDVASEERANAKRSDLLKMHAYRDAIRRSAGAFVLYPGTENDVRPEFHELLPGLGAFALRPTETGAGTGVEALGAFVQDVLTHLSFQTTQHERGRFWSRRSFSGRPSDGVAGAVPFLTKPPGDTLVLLGFVKSNAHQDWIHRVRRYNLRAGGRSGAIDLDSAALGAEMLVLYSNHKSLLEAWSISGNPEIVTRTQILQMGYPNPGGDLYFCLPLERQLDVSQSAALDVHQILRVARETLPPAPYGAPVCTTLATLLERPS